MKKFLYMMAVLPLAVSCLEPVHINDNQYDPAVYFINSGISRTGEFYDIQGKYECKIPVYCGSFTEAAPTVTVQVDESCVEEYNLNNFSSFKVLPADCYSLGESTFELKDRKGSAIVIFDCTKLANFSKEDDYSDLEQYVVPLRLINRTQGIIPPKKESMMTALVSPNMSILKYNFIPPFKAQTSKDKLVVDGQDYVLTYSVATTIANKWDSEVSFEFNTPGMGQTYGIVPTDAFSVDKLKDKFVPGNNSVSFTVRIKRDLFKGTAYSLFARIVVGEGRNRTEFASLFDVMGALKIYPQTSISAYSSNSQSGAATETLEASLDGKQSTYWQPNWGNGSGVLHYSGDDNYYEAVYSFADKIAISAVGISRRNDMANRADIKDCSLSWSADGITWSTPMEYTFATGSLEKTDNPESRIFLPDAVEIQYFRIQCHSSYRMTGELVLANITEFNAYQPAEL